MGLAQINCTVGDLKGNTDKICKYIDEAKEKDVDILAFPELTVTGYPPEDLLLKSNFISDNQNALDQVVKWTKSKRVVAIVGFVDGDQQLYNAAAIIHDGQIVGRYHKVLLPNYGVFDEKRYFTPGDEYPVFEIDNITIGVNICEDIWFSKGPARIQSACGEAKIILNINASPYHVGKGKERERMLADRADENGAVVAYVNMVGGQDELVFDGHSLIVGPGGKILARGRQFTEDLVIADLDTDDLDIGTVDVGLDSDFLNRHETPKTQIVRTSGEKNWALGSAISKPLEVEDEIYSALVMGVRDYTYKNGFKKALIGLSGGIDSALTAVIATDAIGSQNVVAVFMPSVYSSLESGEDARLLSLNLGMTLLNIPIINAYNEYLSTLSDVFKGTETDTAEENIQARIRGNILMAISNKFGNLLLSTGNKSEMSVGYATLYGDMSGGFSALKDVYKTMVYRISKNINERSKTEVIPTRILTKEPTAELRPDQKDSDSLPSYEVLDDILLAYIEKDRSISEIADMGIDIDLVRRVISMVDSAEYKRRQAPPGVKISTRAFGKDRRLPITNLYRG